MASDKRERFNVSMILEGHEVKVSTRFTCSTRAGQGAAYLNSGEIDKRTGVEMGIGCLFAALFQAQEGASEEEIEDCLSASHRTWEHYAELARSRFKGRSAREATVKREAVDAIPDEDLSCSELEGDDKEPIEAIAKLNGSATSRVCATDEDLSNEEL